MSDGWNEELVSVVTDYKIEWQLPAAKQDAIKRLLSSTGAGVGWLEHDGNGPIRFEMCGRELEVENERAARQTTRLPVLPPV